MNTNRLLLSSIILTGLLTGCGGGGDSSVVTPLVTLETTPTASTSSVPNTTAQTSTKVDTTSVPITINFVAKAGDQPVTCDIPIKGLGTTATDANLQDLRLYISEVTLLDANGNPVLDASKKPIQVNMDNILAHQVNLSNTNNLDGNGIAMLSLMGAGGGKCVENANNYAFTTLSGTIPVNTSYQGIRFTIAVPESVNHVDPSNDADYANTILGNLYASNMSWSWQSGRKFTKIEVIPVNGRKKTDGTVAGAAFFVHMGATGCTAPDATKPNSYACSNTNNAVATLPTFNASTQNVVLDLKALFAKNNIELEQGGAGGCMSGPSDKDCNGIFDQLGLDLTSGKVVAPAAVFRAENK